MPSPSTVHFVTSRAASIPAASTDPPCLALTAHWALAVRLSRPASGGSRHGFALKRACTLGAITQLSLKPYPWRRLDFACPCAMSHPGRPASRRAGSR
eukprot:2130883-Prymnesium_polylepis.2